MTPENSNSKNSLSKSSNSLDADKSQAASESSSDAKQHSIPSPSPSSFYDCPSGKHDISAHGCGCPIDTLAHNDRDDCRHDHDHNHDHNHDHENECGHDCRHDHSGMFHTHADVTDKKRLAGALGLTCTIMVAEVIGGIISGSLSLISDAGHMLTDAAALFLSYLALRFSAKPADVQRTFGYSRFEILSALVNAMTLIALGGIIIWEAIGRLRHPMPIQADVMLWVAAIGLMANLISAFLLSDSHSMNVRGAFLHVLGDTLSSVGVIVAALVAMFTGWLFLDPLLSIAIALFIAIGAIRLLKQATHVLLEGAPEQAPFDQVVQSLLSIQGVQDVHDLHLWTLNQGRHAISAHLKTDSHCSLDDHRRILEESRRMLREKYQLNHTTLQLESPLKIKNDNTDTTVDEVPHNHRKTTDKTPIEAMPATPSPSTK